MKAKGTAVNSIEQFVKDQSPADYKNWLNDLNPDAREIFKQGVKSNLWYDVKDSIIEPTQKIVEHFYNNNEKGAWDNGRYSAELGLTGVYKIYVKATTPKHIIDRASRAFAAYYSDSRIKTENKKPTSVDFIIEYMEEPHRIIELRIGGWIEKALEISGCRDININMEKLMSRGDDISLYRLSWQ